MKNVYMLMAALLMGLPVVRCESYAPAEVQRMATIQLEELFHMYQPALEQRLKAEFEPQRNEIRQIEEDIRSSSERLERDRNTLSKADLEKAEKALSDKRVNYQTQAAASQQRWEEQVTREYNQLLQRIQSVTQTVAQTLSIDAVLPDKVVFVHSSNVIDITKPVIAALKASENPAPVMIPVPALAADTKVANAGVVATPVTKDIKINTNAVSGSAKEAKPAMKPAASFTK